PTAGLSPAYLEKIFDLLLDIRKAGVTILMVEQNAKQALRIADTGHVLVNGENFVSGPGRELLADETVRRSFLGGAG
nr:ABC transporter ATP-binding protein [Rhizobiaceae bacterium]